MKMFLSCSILLFLLFGCAGGGAHTADRSTAAPVDSLSATATSAAALPDAGPGAKNPVPTARPVQPGAAQPTGPAWSQSSGGLTVQVFSAAEVQVNDLQYLVIGKAPAGTVITVNDEILVVDSSQSFSSTVALEEGPNLVEIVASSPSGAEVNFLLVVTLNTQK